MPRSRPARDGAAAADAVRVFISYSHDSPPHARRVLALADRLRGEGIDCELDQFEAAPAEGWPVWMARRLREAQFVLVVCTATYHRRVTGRERHGIGLGVRWEGGMITQDLYDRGGQNDKFIPVVLERGDLHEIPDFLRHTTYYDLSDPAQYDRLYRRLTDQPRIVKRPLGAIRPMPPEPLDDASETAGHSPAPQRSTRSGQKSTAAGASRDGTARRDGGRSATGGRNTGAPNLALIRESSGQMYFVPLESVEVSEVTTAVLRPDASGGRAYLENLSSSRYGLPAVDFAFGLTAMRARLTSVVRTFEDGEDRFTLTLAADPGAQGGSFMEMATTGYTADDIATVRARRILLAERLPVPATRPYGCSDDSMLETLVRGLHTSVPVERSPLPELYRAIGGNGTAYFIATAKLTAVLWLHLTGTVAHVLKLEMRLKSRDALEVRFRGQRARLYSNKEPEVITVDGSCPLG